MVGSLFLCQNITMKNIFNLYLSIDEKDILWEIMRLEEEDAVSTNAELWNLSTNATAYGPIGTATEPISASG